MDGSSIERLRSLWVSNNLPPASCRERRSRNQALVCAASSASLAIDPSYGHALDVLVKAGEPKEHKIGEQWVVSFWVSSKTIPKEGCPQKSHTRKNLA